MVDPRPTRRPVPSTREHLLTMAFGAWLIAGLFVDGWAHNNDKPETFFTPWHGLFYSGFLATAAWMAWLVSRRLRAGATGRAAVAEGYGLGLAGVVVFASVGSVTWSGTRSSVSRSTWRHS